jgi:Caspase recruitment domain
LADHCEASDELLNVALSLGCIRQSDRQRIGSERCDYDRLSSLLDIIRTRGTYGFAAFLRCLTECNQGHVAGHLRNVLAFKPGPIILLLVVYSRIDQYNIALRLCRSGAKRARTPLSLLGRLYPDDTWEHFSCWKLRFVDEVYEQTQQQAFRKKFVKR